MALNFLYGRIQMIGSYDRLFGLKKNRLVIPSTIISIFRRLILVHSRIIELKISTNRGGSFHYCICVPDVEKPIKIWRPNWSSKKDRPSDTSVYTRWTFQDHVRVPDVKNDLLSFKARGSIFNFWKNRHVEGKHCWGTQNLRKIAVTTTFGLCDAVLYSLASKLTELAIFPYFSG